MNKIKWVIFAAFVIGILGFLVVFSNNSKINVDKIDVNMTQAADKQNGNIADHVYGNPDSKVTLIAYGDYQCPPCGQAYPLIKSVTEEYKDKIKYIFRNFPLTTIHANAKAAAASAEAAGLQGKYWEMHNKIYENQSDWSTLSDTQRSDFFANYAKDLELDVDKFNSDITTSAITDKINYDLALGKKAGVEGTPTIILDGTKLDSSIWGDSTKFKEAIDKELVKNK